MKKKIDIVKKSIKFYEKLLDKEMAYSEDLRNTRNITQIKRNLSKLSDMIS